MTAMKKALWQTDPEGKANLQDYVKEADNIMYKIKQEVHARDGQPRG